MHYIFYQLRQQNNLYLTINFSILQFKKYNCKMFQQLKIQKDAISQPPHSPSNANKLQQYFNNSSFLLQQQQLAVFIKDLPIIQLKEIKSVNILISNLIKQNQLLGQKCQQQISLIKQEYLKHDKLVRSNKQMKIQLEKLHKQIRNLEEQLSVMKAASNKQHVKNQELEIVQRRLQAQSIKNNALLKEANQKTNRFQELLNLISLEQYKKSQQFVKNNMNDLKSKNNLEEYLHLQRKKSKYLGKVKQIVEQFCIRLDKVTKMVSPTLLAAELSTEANNMIQLVNQLVEADTNKRKKRKTEGSTQKYISSVSQFGGSQKNLGFFEGMIQKLAQSASNNNTVKQTIASQLEQVKNSLYESKSYYQSVLKNLKDQFKQREDEVDKKLHLKEQTIKFYEEEVQKNQQIIENYENQNKQLSNALNSMKRDLENKNLFIQSLQTKLQQAYKSAENDTDRIKEQFESRISELKKMSALKIDQREQLINEYNQKRKKQLAEHESELMEFKNKMKLLQEEMQENEKKLRIHMLNQKSLESQFERVGNLSRDLEGQVARLKRQINDVEEKLNKKNRQIEQFRQTLNSLEHQKKLQSSYITELESKVETLNNKVKNFESKAKNQTTAKKQMTVMKNTIVEQKQRNEQFQMYCTQVKEENQRLKALIKQMKKQLQEVYVRFSELKQIEGERQRLMIQIQSSEREKQQIMKEYQQMKFEMLKLQAENKKMHLQLKHYKNIVNRIKIVQENSY